MPFRREHPREQILRLAAQEAERLGIEEYLVVVRRKGELVIVSSPEEIADGDTFVGVVTDAKGGLE